MYAKNIYTIYIQSKDDYVISRSHMCKKEKKRKRVFRSLKKRNSSLAWEKVRHVYFAWQCGGVGQKVCFTF